ncbi:unnamed protein product [Camellia sinensis]
MITCLKTLERVWLLGKISGKVARPSKKISNKKSEQKFQKPSKKSFKPTRKTDETQVLAMQLQDDVPDFPRATARGGGRSSLGKEVDEVDGDDVDMEFESGERELNNNNYKNKNKRLQKRNHSAEEDDLGSLFGDGISGKLPRFANKITLKNISPGMKLWGVIAEVNEKDIVISLPGGLRGLVRASEAFDPISDNKVKDVETNFLSSIYHVGQLVSCIVLQLGDDKKEKGKRKIWLSLRLALLHKTLTLDVIQEGMVITAYVKSIEDHGYILHFGLPSFTWFMSKNSQAESREIRVNIGQLLQGVVKSVDKTRIVVYLSSDADMVSKCVTKELKGISIDLLIPGMMVNACVQSTLENGIMLSFLTYFTGTVDIFHLQKAFPTSNWKDDYNQNKKLWSSFFGFIMQLVKTGDIFDHSKVIRVDRGFGLLLEVSDVADKDVRKLEKNFKQGSHVRVQILGFRHLEGLAMGVLKSSAFEGSVFTHSDVKPGMVVRAKVTVVDNFGAIVQFPSGVKSLCPLRHMSEFEIAKPRKKFQVGAELQFRVLGCKSKRITVTHKKTLLNQCLELLVHTDATEGLITHGWITKIENHGCFVRFYNGVQGFASRNLSELGLEPGDDPTLLYHVDQVVKCRVTSSVPASRRINLSFVMTPASVPQLRFSTGRVTDDDVAKLGTIVSGVVVSNPSCSNSRCQCKRLHQGYNFCRTFVRSPRHCCTGLVGLMKSVLKPGYGYVCNLIESGCFVRYIERLTGFALRSKATDDRRTNLSEAFYIGQSVRSYILDVSSETGRVTLSLKQSLCSSMDASFIQEYFLLEETKGLDKILEIADGFWFAELIKTRDIAKLQLSDSKSLGLNWVEDFSIVGGITVETGSIVRAVVLDVAKIEHLVDLSLRAAFVDILREETSKVDINKKKRKKESHKELEVHQTVDAMVEIVKDTYLVLSIPQYNFAVGYASLTDYSTQKFPPRQYVNGQSVIATIMALPSPATAGRLLLLLKSISEVTETSSSKRAKKKSGYDVGAVVQAEITEIKTLELKLKFGSGFHGRVHITEANDDNAVENPFKDFRIGQTLTAVIVSKTNKSENNRKNYQWELSIRPSLVSGSTEMGVKLGNEDFSYSIGQHVTGFVYKLDSEWIWLTMSRHVKAQLYVLDSSCEPTELQEFQKRYTVGKAISGYILSANKEKKLLRFVLRLIYSAPDRTLGCETTKIDDTSNHLNGNVAYHIHEGDVVGGRISKILPGVGGMLIKIDPHRYGKVHFIELTDLWVSDPLSGYHEGQFVKCKVLEISHSVKGTFQVDLSLRTTSDGIHSQKSTTVSNSELNNTVGLCHISELSDDHVDNIETKYRAGERVTSKVLKVDEDRQRVSLRMKNSYFMSNYDIQAPSKQKYDDAIEEKDHMNLDFECENGQHPLPAEVEARASILPLEVPLDDIEKSDMVNADAVDQKNKSQAKKKANEEEREIRAAEERLLEKDIPRSADEFEKVVRISPNSSFVWIKYMAFMLSLADVEKARSIAERALKTINIREESEKLNVWVAYFNLENEYGYPPEDVVSKIFGRALQYCDPKKVHLALLGMYERTEQHKLADELLSKMSKKFKAFMQVVWLRRIQWLLNQNQDEVQSISSNVGFLIEGDGNASRVPKENRFEIRLGDVDVIRALFERATSLSLPPKRMKCDEERIESVKRKAMEYVER